MGLNIREIVSRKEVDVSKFKGKILCVDAFNTLYQFLSTIRQMDGTPLMDSKERITSHLSGIFYRNIALMSEGIKLIYVFDGKAPALKAKTYKKRKEARDIAQERYEEAKQEEDYSTMRRYSSQLLRLNDEMIAESKELLESMGIMVVQAPSEGEAESAYLCKENDKIYASVSQDYDSLLFGAPLLVRNLTISRKKKTPTGYIEILPEMISLDEVLKELEINLDQLICLGIIVGTDYNPKGIPRIGQKKALKIVQEHKTPEAIFDSLKEKIDELEEEDKFDWKEIFELFKNHDVNNVEINFPKVNYDKVKKILVEEHEFSEDRVERQLDKLRDLEKAGKQKSLDKWF
ncbi:MAG: flap endonuclease-1 [Nanoarchaeota archaeon]|nr:flap endonuclease-1 [Nanoarchaeota archaeon]